MYSTNLLTYFYISRVQVQLILNAKWSKERLRRSFLSWNWEFPGYLFVDLISRPSLSASHNSRDLSPHLTTKPNLSSVLAPTRGQKSSNSMYIQDYRTADDLILYNFSYVHMRYALFSVPVLCLSKRNQSEVILSNWLNDMISEKTFTLCPSCWKLQFVVYIFIQFAVSWMFGKIRNLFIWISENHRLFSRSEWKGNPSTILNGESCKYQTDYFVDDSWIFHDRSSSVITKVNINFWVVNLRRHTALGWCYWLEHMFHK